MKKKKFKINVSLIVVVLRSLLLIYAGMMGSISFSHKLDTVTSILVGVGAVLLVAFLILTSFMEDTD